MAVRDTTTAQYRYFVTNLVTNQPIAEIPFKGVSYERALKGAGTFSGTIGNSPETASLSLYESTMPGRTGLYVVRDGVCVWGGIIWSRSYNVNERIVSVSASEFTSYFHHRRIWKTWGQVFEATLESNEGLVKATLRSGSTYELKADSTVRFVFIDEGNQTYSGTYTVLAPGTVVGDATVPAITSDVFYTTNIRTAALPSLPNGTYEKVTVYVRTNTYDYVRALIDAMSEDFSQLEFSNTEIQPAKFTVANVLVKSVTQNVATLEVEDNVKLIPGQEVTIRNVDPIIDGVRSVSRVDGNIVTINNIGGFVETENVVNQLYRITSREVEPVDEQTSVVTVTTEEPHELYVGAFINVKGLDSLETATPILNVENKEITETPPDANTLKYNIDTPLELQNLELSAATATVGSSVQFLTRKEVQTVETDRVATITTGEQHDFEVGQTVVVADLKDYATVAQRELASGVITYTTAANHNFQVGANVTVTGLADTANVIQRAMTFAGSTATFTITTSIPHNLQTGNTVTISSLKDSYRIRGYEYFSNNNIATFYTGTTSANVSHNIQATNTAGSIEVANLPSTSVGVSQVSASGGNVTLTTSSAHGIQPNSTITVSGVGYSSAVSVTSISRTSNVTTITTSGSHGLSAGQSFYYGGGADVRTDATGFFTVQSSSSNTITYSNPASSTPTVTLTPGSVTLNCLESETWENRGGDTWRLQSPTGSIYSQADTVYQGDPQDGQGFEVGAIRFQSFAANLPSGVSLSDVVSVTGVSLTASRRGSVGNSGTTLYLGIHDTTNLGSRPPYDIFFVSTVNWTNWPTTGRRTISLPSDWYQFFQNGEARGVIVGLQNSDEGWYTGTAQYMGIYGEGSGSNEPTLTVNYTYNAAGGSGSSDFSVTGGDLGSIFTSFGGYDGTFTVSTASGNSLGYISSGANDTGGTQSSGGSVIGASSLLNKIYTFSEIISKTANSITVSAPSIGVNVSQLSLSSGVNGLISQNSIFNVANVIVNVISSTQITYTNNATYNINVASETPSPLGRATVVSTLFNVNNATITSVTSNTLTVATVNTSTVAKAAAVPTGVAEADSPIVGTYAITAATTDTLKYVVANTVLPAPSTAIFGYSAASTEATLAYGTYGSYKGNSDLGFEFSTDGYSDDNVLPDSFRGFELTNIGEQLEQYTDKLEGFDYRVDCYIDPNNGAFKRQFVMVPVYPTAVKEYIEALPNGSLALGQTVPLTYFGADNLVFEFPGNISDLQMEENAENAVTRFFMVGNIGDLGDDISQPYAAAADTSLLNPPAGTYPWPILDDDEAAENISDESELYSYAERYMLENRPPAGFFTVSVNGSAEPVVGSYAPGDWCSLIINDDFVKQRLSSDLEPRGTVLLRRINSFSVEVPDSITFPEKITLQLIPEWQVDKRGE
jgi:hypothetical protein